MNKSSVTKQHQIIIGLVIILLMIGIFMVHSASHIWTTYNFDDPYFYVKRQLIFGVFGLVAMSIVMRIPYLHWKQFAIFIYTFCLILLILVLIPGIGVIRGGAQSWIGFGLFSIQPSEFAKLGTIIFVSYFLSETTNKQNEFMFRFALPLLFVSIPFLLIMQQPDLGTGVVLMLTIIVLLFIHGTKMKYFLSLFMIGIGSFAFLIMSAPYRLRRIISFIDPWKDPQGDGFQIIQSLLAIGPGKLLGVGYGNSIQKHFYLPEPQTDFIFSIIAEEFGLIGSIILVCLFFILCYHCWKIAIQIRDLFAKYIVISMISMVMIQVYINISVVIGLIPVTGITLPFISYGGSSLTLTLISFGIILNCSKYAK